MVQKRYSRQRELIYDAVIDSKSHPTAEMVYSWLKPSNPSLSMGTVYRNLNLLAQEGKLNKMPFPVERYDGETTPHPHFSCKVCGQVSDLSMVYDPQLDEAAAQCGPQVDGHTILFTGTCIGCITRH